MFRVISSGFRSAHDLLCIDLVNMYNYNDDAPEVFVLIGCSHMSC